MRKSKVRMITSLLVFTLTAGSSVPAYAGNHHSTGHYVPSINGTVNGNYYPFVDVHSSDWHCQATDYVFSRNIMTGMNGMNGTYFKPSDCLSRGQFATVLYRMKDNPNMLYDPNAFSDIADGQFYTSPVMWSKATGIIQGYGDKTFGPADNITREQLALIMYRYANLLNLDTSAAGNLAGYPDGHCVSGFAHRAMRWAVGEGLIQGDGGYINPQGKVDRAQCATIIMRYMEKYGL